MLSRISKLTEVSPNMVHLLPFRRSEMKNETPGKRWNSRHDFRLICDCQEHARREQTLWRRSVRAAGRAARGLRKRGLALLVGVPLAFGALEFPGEALNVTTLAAEGISAITSAPTANAALPIFTDRVRNQFLTPEARPVDLSLEVVREQFFSTYVPYGAIIYREARRNNLPPELVAAVVEAESDFRPRLISHKNAQGLMQIIPSTGRLMGADDLFNPAENIAAGTKYLRYLYNRFGSDQRMVLAAYNAGEGNVDKFGGIPPFPETQNYLRRVGARTSHYRFRIHGTYAASLRMRNAMLAN